LNTWLIDTALFKSLAAGGSKGGSLRSWVESHDDSLFLSTASLVEIQAAIDKISHRDVKRGDALHQGLDGLVLTFTDRIHPIDVKVAIRAGGLLPYRQQSNDARHRFHDAVLIATAQIHGHSLLTNRVAIFGAWTHVKVASAWNEPGGSA
jgi:predicted nucleic acid-binding protein